MDFWLNLWIIVLVLGVIAFAGLAVVVAITGFGNIRALFRALDAQHRPQGEPPFEQEPRGHEVSAP